MKEFSSKSYLKDIKNYELKIYINKENYYITIKKVNNIKSPFILNEMGHDIKLLDNNYYIFEYVPHDRNYFLRLFIDDNKEIVEEFYQFTEEHGIEDSIPYYLKSNFAFIKSKYGDKIYLKENDVSEDIITTIKQDKIPHNLDYKKYLW